MELKCNSTQKHQIGNNLQIPTLTQLEEGLKDVDGELKASKFLTANKRQQNVLTEMSVDIKPKANGSNVCLMRHYETLTFFLFLSVRQVILFLCTTVINKNLVHELDKCNLKRIKD